MKHPAVSSALLILTALLIAACAPAAGQSTLGPTTWIDVPLDGASLPLGPMEITAHASDSDGVSSFDFYIDNTLLAHANAVASAPVQVYSTGYSGSPGTAGYLASATVGWNPSTAGVYTIRAVATDTKGNLGTEAKAVVTVGQVQISPVPSPAVVPTEEIVAPGTPTHTATPTGTPVVPTWTPPPPGVTPLVPTWTPKPPTVTPPPPARRPEITYFEANPSTINAGGCSNIRWGVEYAAEVYLDGEGAVDHAERQVCPPTTTAYTLYARSAGGEDQESITVTVIEEPTATPEPTPMPIVTVIVVDVIPPYITNLDADPDSIMQMAWQCSGGTTTVSVYAEDVGSGVGGVRAYWTLESQSGQVDMTHQGGGVYEAVLGPFSISQAPANLAISFVAWDTVGNSTPYMGPINVSVTSCIG